MVDALRAGTRAEHDAIERELDWRVRASDAAAYRAWLERLYGFHRIWEPQVAQALQDPVFFEPRRKLHLLATDLDQLGVSRCALEFLPSPTFASGFATVGQALGSMYVVEGSTLGGQLIARHVKATLGFAPSYHVGYRRRTAGMWRQFQERLEKAVEPARTDKAVCAARATFAQLRSWLTSV